MTTSSSTCAICSIPLAERICRNPQGRHPKNCPTVTEQAQQDDPLALYNAPETLLFARQASLQEKDGYLNREAGYAKVRPAKPRIEEIIDFINKMSYKKIGLAFCMGLAREAKMVDALFRSHDLEVVSAICKIGGVSKEKLGLKNDEQISCTGHETMCNPILQATTMNKAETEFNVLLGLCVGHDSLFFQHAKAPTTVFAVKDRVTGHNPLAALYTLDSYYRALK